MCCHQGAQRSDVAEGLCILAKQNRSESGGLETPDAKESQCDVLLLATGAWT